MENGKYEISFAPIYGEEKENKDNTDIDNTTDSKDQSDNRTSKLWNRQLHRQIRQSVP